MIAYNPKTIVSVSVRDFTEFKDLKYLPEHLGFFGSRNKFWGYNEPGFYSAIFGYYSNPWTREELERGACLGNKFLVKDNKVLFFPEVSISFVNKTSWFKTFSTMNEADSFRESVIKLALQNDFIYPSDL